MSSVSVPAAATSGSTLGTITNQNQFDTSYTQFLSMLTTELQNQDPTSPMDATQFTNQLVGFSQLEQQLQTNSNLQTLITNQGASTLGNSLGYLGKTVVASGSSFSLPTDGSATIDYALPSTASSATMNIMDSSGQTVGTLAIPTTAGAHKVAFDGSTSDGSTLPAGVYTYGITALDATGAPVTATTYTAGVVTGVDTSSGSAVLHLGDLEVAASDVVQVTS